MTCVGSLVELRRQIRPPGKRAEPFAILVDEATKLPGRKLELDQSKRRVRPCAGRNAGSERFDQWACKQITSGIFAADRSYRLHLKMIRPRQSVLKSA